MKIPYGRQNITDADIAVVTQVLKEDFLTQGPHIEVFETAFAQYVQSKYAVAVSNGTAALHLAALALGVTHGTKVITTPITFAASGNCVLYCGGEVHFADIDADTALMDLGYLEQLLNDSPPGTYSGVIPVDFAGYPIDLEALQKIAKKHNLWILEDACHAPGGAFIDSMGSEQKCGNGRFADLAIFSFHPVKHIASGEGGMITTNDVNLYERLLMLRTHGITKSPSQMTRYDGGWYHEMQMLGYNYRITDFQCALGKSQLERAEDGLARRREIAKLYDAAFNDLDVTPIAPAPGVLHAYHLYVIKVNNRKTMFDALRAAGIFAQVHYIPMHLHPYYQSLGYAKGDFPIAESYYDQCLSLPMFPTLTRSEQEYVIQIVRQNA